MGNSQRCNRDSRAQDFMRRAALLCLLAALPVAAQVSPYKQISFNWDYAPNLPVCGSALISCFAGFQMSDLLSGHTIVTLPPSARSWVFVPNGGVQYGKHTFLLVALGYDVTGLPVQSAPASVIVDVTPPPTTPTALIDTVQ